MGGENEDRLEQIQARWLEQSERGEAPRAEDLLEEYPEHADRLREWFATRSLLEHVSPSQCEDPLPKAIGGYEILRRLGRGAMGIVYEARQTNLDRRVALKTLSPEVANNARAVARFQTEARAAARIQHENLLPIYQVGKDGSVHFYAMELVEGRSLEQEIASLRARGLDSLVDLDRARLDDYVGRYAGVCEALNAANEQGVLHRDVKPSNIMLTADGTMKLVDFGLAREESHPGVTMTGDLVGTPMYMSPEQIRGTIAEMDARSDIYALGITLYELITLRPPYQSASVAELAQRILTIDPAHPKSLGIVVPRELEAIMYKAFDKDPARRYASALEMAADLRNFVALKPVSAAPQTSLVRLRKRLQRNRTIVRTVAWTLLAATLAALAVFGLPALRNRLVAREAEQRDVQHEAEARKLYEAGCLAEPDEAARCFTQIKTSYADTSRYLPALYEMGLLRLRAGDREGAQAEWAGAYAAAPQSRDGIRALVALGRTFQDVGWSELSLELSQTALGAAEGTERAQALLLAGEAALAEGDGPGALHCLAQCEELRKELPVAENERLARVRELLERFLPCTSRYLAKKSRQLYTGRFGTRSGRPILGLLTVDEDSATLHPVVGGEIDREGILTWPLLSPSASVSVVDVDGTDGLDEIVEISYEAIGDTPEERGRTEQTLRIISVANGSMQVRSTHRGLGLPLANYVIRAADVDRDARPELVLGQGYPGQGLDVYKFDGDGALIRMEPGALAELRGPGSANNVRDVAVGDLDADGRAELVVACAEHRHFAIKAYVFDEVWKGLDIGEGNFGPMGACRVVDGEGTGYPRLIFGAYAHLAEGLEARLDTFLPQGIHELRYDADSRTFRRRALDTGSRLSLRPRGEQGLLPWNTGIHDLVTGRLGSAKYFVAASETSRRLKEARFNYLLLRDIDAPAGRGLILRRTKDGAAFGSADWDDDGRDELLVLDWRTGMLHVHGLGTMPAASALTFPQRPAHARVGDLWTRQEAGQLLLKMGFYGLAEDTYRRLREDAGGGLLEEDAFLRMISAIGHQGRYDECLQRLETWRTNGMDGSRRALHAMIGYCERTGQMSLAARLCKEAAKPGGVDETSRSGAERRAAALEPWLDPPPAMRLPFPERWEMPPSGFFAADGEGGVRLEAEAPAPQTAWADISWTGESFSLSFDVRLEALPVGRNFSLGFLSNAADGHPFATALAVRFGSTSGQHRSVALMYRSPRDPAPRVVGVEATPGRGLPPDHWYRLTLTRDASSGTAWLGIRDAESTDAPGELYAVLELKDVEAPPGPTRLGLGAGEAEWPKRSAYRIRNVVLVRP